MLSNNWNIFELNCFRIIEYVLDVGDDVQILVVNGFGVCFYFYGQQNFGGQVGGRFIERFYYGFSIYKFG